ncbi:hypothetical protein [Pseudotabrizicola sp. 4114]|nr:hypothetical protein [Pseudorhodobacter sp. 4114]
MARAHEVLQKADGYQVAFTAEQLSDSLHGDKRLQQTLYRL